MKTCKIKLKNGTDVSGYVWDFKPEEGFMSVANSDPDSPVKIRFEDIDSGTMETSASSIKEMKEREKAGLIGNPERDVLEYAKERLGMKIEEEWKWLPACKCDGATMADKNGLFCNRCGKAYLKINAKDPLDYSGVDEGVRQTVKMLREYGFNTTDSGDGSKSESMDCAVDFPMIAMTVEDPESLTMHARRLMRILKFGHDVKFGNGEKDPRIEASYSPVDGVAVIVLSNVLDKMLKLE